MSARCFILIFSAVLILSGCTSVSYKSNSAENPPKPENYPIPVYIEDQQVPRPCRVIGTLSVNAGNFTMFGGSPDTEMFKVMQSAHQKGADAVKITTMDKPGFTNPNYRIQADLLRYADVWETVGLSKTGFQKYLDSNRATLDPIEGFWYSGGLNPHSIGIIKDKSKPGRDLIGFIIETQNPVWSEGMKKIDIRRGLEPGSYVLTYYLDDFARREAHILLKQQNSFAFMLEKADDNGKFITYTKFENF